jgi:hypothetical protein
MALTKISTDGVKDDAITKAKIPADQIEASELANNAVDTNAIQDDAVTEDKLANSINTAIAANTAKDLTALSASNLTSGTIPDARLPATLPAISGANLTNLPASGKAHNLVINGAMQVAQRGTSVDISSTSYGAVDRFQLEVAGLDNAVTMAQADVASGTTPYTLGFRKALKLTNGDQSNGAGATDTMRILHKFEAQDIAQSGWNYKSASSFITLSFWIKSSVAQSFKVALISWDGSIRTFVFDTGSLTADTWTKVTKTIPGNSNITIDNDNNLGFQISFFQYLGTTYTASSGYIEDQWNAFANPQTPDQTSTWYTTNDATFEITGIQLEVGSNSTDFEFTSFADELIRCKRYYRILQDASGGACYMGAVAYNYDGNSVVVQVNFETEMRATPTLDNTSGTNYYRFYRNSGYVDINAFNAINGMNKYGGGFNNSDSGNGTAGQAGAVVLNNTAAKLAFDADL